VVPLKAESLAVCIDANVYISGIAFGGNPLKIVERALNRDFLLITSPQILTEVQRNLLGKLDLNKQRVTQFLHDIMEISSVFVPTGNIKFIEHVADNLVLETALIGGANVLVTGDKKHLLPLGNFRGMSIEPPSKFLARFV
jgi:putative PIN family toxin of toxin-antitoxin system